MLYITLNSSRDWCSIISNTTHSIQLENEELNKITRQLKPRNIFFLLFVNVNFKKSYLLYYTWRKALKVLEFQCKMLGFFTSFLRFVDVVFAKSHRCTVRKGNYKEMKFQALKQLQKILCMTYLEYFWSFGRKSNPRKLT